MRQFYLVGLVMDAVIPARATGMRDRNVTRGEWYGKEGPELVGSWRKASKRQHKRLARRKSDRQCHLALLHCSGEDTRRRI